MSAPEQPAPALPSQTVSVDDRRSILAGQVSQHLSQGYRLEQQNEYQAVMVKGRRVNHLLHFIIGIVTLTVWWFLVWLPLGLFGGEKRRMITVDAYGNVAVSKGRG